jgi:hypothetical protein
VGESVAPDWVGPVSGPRYGVDLETISSKPTDSLDDGLSVDVLEFRGLVDVDEAAFGAHESEEGYWGSLEAPEW